LSHESITTPSQLADLCGRLRGQTRIGFDTEFVSEDTFRPELCLIQVVAEGVLAVIDPQKVGDLKEFWEVLADGSHVTLVHAMREEVSFSLTAIGRPPANIFDTQIAAGLCGPDYPAAYGNVVTRYTGKKANKGEQRTDWRKRPLTKDQIEYALEDVRYLFALHDAMLKTLTKLGRLEWLAEEHEKYYADLLVARTQPRWRRVSGIGNLPTRSLAIVRELWQWRQEEAERRDLPPRRVLRDDLLVELAKRKMDSPDKIRAVRGMMYGQLKNSLNDIAACVKCGLTAPLDDIRGQGRTMAPAQVSLLGQFLTPAITSICHKANVAASLAGTASDVRDLIAFRLGYELESEDPPILASGWRAELIGHLIEDLIAGRKSIRIGDPESDHPLEFDEVPPTA
jgi:ribonuclease D